MDKSLANKIFITLGFLFAYRILAYVQVPGVNIDIVKEFFTMIPDFGHKETGKYLDGKM